MVKLEEEIDEQAPQVVDNSDDYEDASDSASNLSDDEEDELNRPVEESLWDRIVALHDIVPMKRRAAISNATASSYRMSVWGLGFAGRTIWAVTTSVLLLGFPLLLAFEDEQKLIEMEKDIKIQQGANELLAPTNQSQDQKKSN